MTWRTWAVYDVREGEIELGDHPTLALAVQTAEQHAGRPLTWNHDDGWWYAHSRATYSVFQPKDTP